MIGHSSHQYFQQREKILSVMMNKIVSLIISAVVMSVGITFSMTSHAQYEPQIPVAARQTNNIYFRFEQRLVLAYLLESVGLSDSKKSSLAQRMEKTLKVISERGVEWVEVSSIEEYIQLQKGEWPNTHRLSMDLRVIEKHFEENSSLKVKMYFSKNPVVQKQIISYHIEAAHSFVQTIQSYKIPLLKGLADFSLKSVTSLIEDLRRIPSSMTKTIQQAMAFYQNVSREGIHLEALHNNLEVLSSAVSRPLILHTFVAAESILHRLMGEIEPIINEILTELKGVGLKPGEMRALEILFKGYFHELSLDSKKLMLNALLELPTHATVFEKFQLMVQLADPVFQKCMQLFARTENMSPKIEKIFQSLESSGREVPWFIARSIMESELSKYNLFDISKESLGIGTLRVYHLAKLRLPNGQIKIVVIGYVKPDMSRRVDEGEHIMKTLAPKVDADPLVQESGLPKMTSFIPDTMRFIRRELDTDQVRQWQTRFFKTYRKNDSETFKKNGITLEFLAPAVFEPRSKSSSLLVQEFVPGEKLDEALLKNEISIPDLKKMVVERLALLWLNELLFGEGLYHGDLHHGNIKMQINVSKILFPIIDYGMSGELSLKGRSQFMKLGASIELLDAHLMTEIFLAVSDQSFTRIKYADLLQKIQEKIQNDGVKVSREIDAWIPFVTQLDFKLRPEFMDMMRGYFSIQKLLKEVKSDMSFKVEAKKLALQHPMKGSFLMLMGSVGTPRPTFWKMADLITTTMQNKSRLVGQCKNIFASR